jgi:hypothetical protein
MSYQAAKETVKSITEKSLERAMLCRILDNKRGIDVLSAAPLVHTMVEDYQSKQQQPVLALAG